MAQPIQDKATKKWSFSFDVYENGKRKQIRRRGFKSKRDALDALQELQQKVKEQEYVWSNSETVSSFVQKWLETERKLECEEATYYNNQLYFKNHVQQTIGKIKLQTLDSLTCQKFVNKMHEKGYARNTIERVTTMLKLAFDRAVVHRIISQNPMRLVKLPKKIKRELKVWTAEEVRKFLEYTQDHRYFCIYALALFTGMRKGEILALRWRDIDFPNRMLYVNQTLVNYGKTIKTGAKTSSGVRAISIPESLIDILLEQKRKYIQLQQEIKEKFVDMDLVIFNLANGKQVFPANLTKTYIKHVKESGLPYITFHALRHTHATLLIEKNVNVKLISDRLGHSKISVTLDVYSHVTTSMQREVADQIEQIISM